MRADAIDLDICGNHVRVLCGEANAASPIRDALRKHIVTDAAPVGFAIQPPQSHENLHVLLDRSGFVLGRSRSYAGCASMLLSHLGALVPPPSGTIRLKMRAVFSDDGRAVLAEAPLFVTPPAVERRITRAGYRLLDRLVVDMNGAHELEFSPSPWMDPRQDAGVDGHTYAPPFAASVSGLLTPQLGSSAPTRALRIAGLAALMSSESTIERRLDAAEWLAEAPTTPVAINDSTSLYSSLANLSSTVSD